MIKVSVIQCNQKILYDVRSPGIFDYALCVRLSREVIEQNLAMMEQAAHDGAHLIVTTEAFNACVLPGDTRYDLASTVDGLDGEVFERCRKLSRKYKTHIVGGLYNKRGGKVYNSGVLFGPDGDIVGIYDKVHLAGTENQGLTAGNTFPVFKTEIGNIGILVCWDMQYPEAARELVLGGCDIIACPTWGWENIYGLARAYENDVVIAAAMAVPPSGVIEGIRSPSCIVDGLGNILAQGDRCSPCIVSAEVDLYEYLIDGKACRRRERLAGRRPEAYGRITQH